MKCIRCDKNLDKQVLHNGVVDFNICDACHTFKEAEKICNEIFGLADVGELKWEDVETLKYILEGEDERTFI